MRDDHAFENITTSFLSENFANFSLTLITELKPGSGEPPRIELLPS